MVKVKQVKTSTRKTVNNKPIKKKGTLINKLKANKRRGLKPKALVKKKDKGVVYLSHIPHGFYDEQIEGFFSQFGKVSQVSVPKAKSGKSKGYAFVEFVHPEVAKIAAETMNNYLMFNRLLKAKYIAPENTKPRLFKKAQLAKEHHKTESERAVLSVKDNRKKKNAMLKTSQEARVIKRLQKKSAAAAQRMAELGVNYEVQVEQGNCESVLERMKNLEERRKLQRKEAKAEKKKNKRKEDSSPPGDDENLSSSASVDENLSSSDDENSSSENIDKTENHKSKATSGMLNKLEKPVPLVINPSKLENMIKSARGEKNTPMKSNKLTNKPQEKNFKVSSYKRQKQLKSNKSSEKRELLSKTTQKHKGFQKKVIPPSTKLHVNVQGKPTQRKSPKQPQKLLQIKQKSPAEKALKATKSNLPETVTGDISEPTPSKKVKQSKSLEETIQSPMIKVTQKTRQKSPKTVVTPKRLGQLNKSESLGKSPKKRKSQGLLSM